MKPSIAALVAAAMLIVVGFCCGAVAATCGLTDRQKSAISADLALIDEWGYANIRLITYAKVNDPAYDKWPAQNFLSFPTPTPHEVENLREFFTLVDRAGMSYELVIVLSDSGGLYYRNGVTDADYKKFIDTIWPALWVGKLNRLYVGGDMQLGDGNPNRDIVLSHRRWLKALWPYVVERCRECDLGVELMSADASFWDQGAAGVEWLSQNLSPRPSYAGFQLYPTTHAALKGLGFENNGRVDWGAVAKDWLRGLTAAASPIAVQADEVGLAVGNEFTEQDQADFLAAAVTEFNQNTIKFNVWEFADHPTLGSFGLLTQDRQPRKAARLLPSLVWTANRKGLLPGLHYTPPGYDDLAWLMPENSTACTP